MKTYSRKVPTNTAKEPPFKRLTNKQLAVYYWLVTNSRWNSKEQENHYYIYNSDFTNTQIGKELNIKSRDTVRNALNTLEMYGYICRLKEYIVIPHAEKITYLDVRLIKWLLKQSKVKSVGAEFILFYSILKRLFEINSKNDKKTDVTPSLMMKLLGYSPNETPIYDKFRLYFAIFEHYGLIKLKKNYILNNLGVKCYYFTLLFISETTTKDCEYNMDYDVKLDEQTINELETDLLVDFRSL